MNITDLGNIIRQIIKEEVHNNNETHVPNKLVMTSTDLAEIRQSILIRYEKLIKIENTISIFNSHLENNTVPSAISHANFPKPFWTDDAVFIDEHNEIIRQSQRKMINAIIDRGRKLCDSFNLELREYRSNLDLAYDGNTDRFMDNLKSLASSNLKQVLEAVQKNGIEDPLKGVYGVQENSSEEYINSYLDFNEQKLAVIKKNNENVKEKTGKNNIVKRLGGRLSGSINQKVNTNNTFFNQKKIFKKTDSENQVNNFKSNNNSKLHKLTNKRN